MRIRIFRNTDRNAIANGYDPATSVMVEVLAYDDDAADHHDALETAFERLNVGDDPEFGTPHADALVYRMRGNQSLSVGDVVACDRSFYACAPSGWQPIAHPQLVTPVQPGTTSIAPPTSRTGRQPLRERFVRRLTVWSAVTTIVTAIVRRLR